MSTVLVTGAVVNTGRAIAEKFAEAGDTVVITSRDAERAEIAAAEIAAKYAVNCYGFSLCQHEEASVMALFDRLTEGNLLPDKLILCAADLGQNMDTLTVSARDFAKVIDTNIVGEFMLIREAAVRHMIPQKQGAVVVIGSSTSRRALRNRAAYCASKGGLVSLVRALALDFGQYHIRVNALLPGSIHSERWDTCGDEVRTFKRSRIPLGQEAFPKEIADTAYFLASDGAAAITGAEIVADCGVDVQLFPNA